MNFYKIIVTLIPTVSVLVTYAQSSYAHDRVYTGNQVSNTVSVIDPSQNKFLGEIKLGLPFPNVLSALYRGQAQVHVRYSPQKKMEIRCCRCSVHTSYAGNRRCAN